MTGSWYRRSSVAAPRRRRARARLASGPDLRLDGVALGSLIDRHAGCRERADFSEAHRAQHASIEINETQTLAARGDLSRERVVAERTAAEMRHDPADIGHRLDLHMEKHQADAVGS